MVEKNGRKRSEFVEIFLDEKEMYDETIITIKAIPKPIEVTFISC